MGLLRNFLGRFLQAQDSAGSRSSMLSTEESEASLEAACPEVESSHPVNSPAKSGPGGTPAFQSARLLLLTKYLQPCAADRFSTHEGWRSALRQEPVSVVDQMCRDDLLAKGSTSETLEASLLLRDLKKLLKDRGLKVSGKKAQLVDRLIASDPIAAKELAEHEHVLVCTVLGKATSEEYLRAENQRRRESLVVMLKALKAGDHETALSSATEMDSHEVKLYAGGADATTMKHVLRASPLILGDIEADDLRILRALAIVNVQPNETHPVP